MCQRFFAAVLILFAAVTLPLNAQEADPELSQVDNFLAQAYQAIEKDDTATGEELFNKAAKKAKTIGDWQGLIDAGYGLAALGKINDALSAFQKGASIAKKQNSWQGLVAAGYALSSLPKEKNLLSQAETAFSDAQAIAEQTKDVPGIMEVAKAFNAIGNPARGAQAQTVANALNRELGGDSRGVKTPPPPGWSPVGKSVRDPNQVSEESQRLNRASVDKDIDNKMAYIQEQERLKVERERNRTRLAEAYLYYSGYYGYPGSTFGIRDFGLYGFGLHPLSRSHLHSFASFHLSRFSHHGGLFIRVDRHRFHRHH